MTTTIVRWQTADGKRHSKTFRDEAKMNHFVLHLNGLVLYVGVKQ